MDWDFEFIGDKDIIKSIKSWGAVPEQRMVGKGLWLALKTVQVTEMYLGLADVYGIVELFADGIDQGENTRPG